MQAKATVAVKGQGGAVKGTVGLIGGGSVWAYDGGEGLADEGVVRAGRSISGGRGGELEPVGGGDIGAVAEEEELTLGRGVNLLGVMQTLEAS